jgi:predicted permease
MKMWIARVKGMFHRTRWEDELERDIQEHLEMAVEENLRRGMGRREAELAARRSFGGVDRTKEAYRDQRGVPLLETLARESRFAWRSLRRAPGYASLAILTLGVAIGTNAAIYGAVRSLLFNPPGVSAPDRLMVIRARYEKLNLFDISISINDFKDVAGTSRIFAAAAIAKTGDARYIGGAYPQQLAAQRVTWRWFDVLGAKPALGRVFTPEEDTPDNNHVVLLSHATWERLFGSDPSIVGKTITFDQLPYRVVGVMAPEFTFGSNEMTGLSGRVPDVYFPLGVREMPRMRFVETFLGIARLQPGVTISQAQSFMGILTRRGYELRGIGPIRKENGWGLSALPYTDFVSGDIKTPMLILWGAVGFVLLIACLNVAGLTLARMTARSRELAVRTALGGSRWQLVRQLFLEGSMVALAGSIVGLAVAYVGIRVIGILAPEKIMTGLRIPFDFTLLWFTGAIGMLAAILSALVPAIQLSRGNTSERLKEGSRTGTVGRERLRLRSMLVTAQVALALLLSIGAGLLLRSLTRLQRVELGFQPAGVMTTSVSLPETRYRNQEAISAFYRTALQKLTAAPRVQSAAAVYPLPFGAGYEGRAFEVVGRPARPNGPAYQGNVRLVTPGFFATMGIPIKRGRNFAEQEKELVAIIDEALARQYWPGEDPIGQSIRHNGVESRIVGIVGHTKDTDLASRVEKGVFYHSLYQDPLAFGTLVVRGAGDAQALGNVIREVVRSIDAAQPTYDAKMMSDRVQTTLAGRRFTISLLALFAVGAILLAAIGLYGVISYSVTQRTQEIGIRLVLGAEPATVVQLILRAGLRIAAIGVGVGAVAAFAAARLFSAQLFAVSAFDPVTFIAMALVLSVVALAASYLPALRAARLDPLTACRYE